MRKLFAFALAVLALSMPAAGANLIVNGSFEAPPIPGGYEYVPGGLSSIAGWQTILTGAERFDPHIYAAGAAQDGSLCLDLNTDYGVGGGIQQTVPTDAGQTYALSFYVGTWYAHGRNGTGHMEVVVDGNSQSFTVTNLTPTIVWTHFTTTFRATSSNTTITFRNFDNPNETFSLLDDVSLEPTCSATVVIDGCDTGVSNSLPNGCISDRLAACAQSATNHGDFVNCVSHLADGLKKAGVIDGKQQAAIVSCAAKAQIP